LADTHRYDRKQLIAEAHRARNRGRNRQAIALYRRILIDEPKNTEVALRAAPLLAYHGASFEAWQLFSSAANVLLRGRRIEAGLGVLREACRCVPHEFEAWRQCARLEIKLKRDETAHQTLLEGRQHFRTPQTRAQAIALLTRARSIEPWDPEVCIDLARLYMGTGQVEVALGVQDLRKVRALQWRITLSFRDGWLWLRAVLAAQNTRSEKRASAPSKSVEAPTDGLCDVT